jgi:opacity protein-like surface antigen
MEKPQVTLARTLFLIVALSCLAAAAQSADLDFELTPYGGYRFGGTIDIADSDGSYKLDDSASFGLLFNWRHSGNTQWEILYSQQQTDARLRNETNLAPIVETDIHTLQLGGTYQGTGDKARPYVAMTLGGTHIRASANGSQSDTFFSGSLGVGVNMFPTSRFGLRLEARGHLTLITSSTSLFCNTGPDANVCAIQVTGDTLNQVETFAGFVFRF